VLLLYSVQGALLDSCLHLALAELNFLAELHLGKSSGTGQIGKEMVNPCESYIHHPFRNFHLTSQPLGVGALILWSPSLVELVPPLFLVEVVQLLCLVVVALIRDLVLVVVQLLCLEVVVLPLCLVEVALIHYQVLRNP
jgi:hypothetical protein